MADQQTVAYSAAKVIMRYLDTSKPTEEVIVDIIDTEVVPVLKAEFDQERADLEAKAKQKVNSRASAYWINNCIRRTGLKVSVMLENSNSIKNYYFDLDHLSGLDCTKPRLNINTVTNAQLEECHKSRNLDQFRYSYDLVIPAKYDWLLEEDIYGILPDDDAFRTFVTTYKWILEKVIGNERLDTILYAMAPSRKKRRTCPSCTKSFIQ